LYSNAGYTIISLVLERVSGKKFEALLTDFLSKELNADCIFGWPNNYNSEQPWGHANFAADSVGNLSYTKIMNSPFGPESGYKLNELIKPAGDVCMRPVDFAKYTQLYLKGLRGVDQFIKSETFNYIARSKKGFSMGISNGKSMGKEFAGFDGSAGTFICRGVFIPSDDMALTIVINSGNMKAVEWLTMKIFKKQYNWWWKVWM
jgi:D-alanyl-D-alanine carboxypeptidase